MKPNTDYRFEASDTILAKIKALLAKTTENGATQAEAQTAFAKAQEIMAKYGIDSARLAASFGDDTESAMRFSFDKEWVKMGRGLTREDSFTQRIVNAVSPGVQVLRYTYYGLEKDARGYGKALHGFCYIGEEMDREMAKILMTFLLSALPNAFRAYRKASPFSRDNAAERNSFYEGMYSGMLSAYAEGKARAEREAGVVDADRYSLVLTNKADALSAWVREEMEVTHRKNTKGYGSRAAHEAGFQAGRKMDINMASKLG